MLGRADSLKYTPRQIEAIEHHDSNLQLVACAGSGKTEVVALHVVNLLRPHPAPGLFPRNIAAITFTEKAGAELKERIVQRCRRELGTVIGLAEMYVGTIHGWCLDLLRSEIPKYLKFSVLNEVQQRLLIDRACRQAGLTTSTDLNGRNLRRYIDTGRYMDSLNILREAQLDRGQLDGCSVLQGLQQYRLFIDEKGYLDYSAIMENAVFAMLKDEGLRARLGARIKHLIVDEYQDVNPIQEAVVQILHDLGATVSVVGDDDQTIYQWRGSDVSNILTFTDRYPSVHSVALEENFRSSEGVIAAARDFIAQNQHRLKKEMIPTGAQPYEDGDVVALSFANPDEEADFIAATIKQLHGVAIEDDGVRRGLAFSDFAVLLRSVHANGEPITDALDRAGIRYIIEGMNQLFDAPEAEAARQSFYFMAGRPGVTTEVVKEFWRTANLGIGEDALEKGVAALEASQADLANRDRKRWGLYNIQRVYLRFLEDIELREERVPDDRGEVTFYNLGKFSELISDFETIHFHSQPFEKYRSFADFLQYRAAESYPEGWQDNQYVNPDAVRVMTVHQAKGKQWPVVFMPALLRNRFPSAPIGGANVWHLVPREAVVGQARYEGGLEDERRLFYVAMTRSQKFLFLTWAPIAGRGNRYARASEFWDDVLVSKWVKRRQFNYSTRDRLPAEPKAGVTDVSLSFSELKYFFECPYQFKLRILYGFNAPLDEALGYGKSLHDALADVHTRAIRGEIPNIDDVEDLVATHLHVPFAYPALREELEQAAERTLTEYIQANADVFDKIEFAEKTIEINLGGGVSVVGRIDLIRRLDTDEVYVVDLKSTKRAQAEEVTETQLHVYALGYQDLVGKAPDFVEIYNLDEGKRKPRSVDEIFIADVKVKVRAAADALRVSDLPAVPEGAKCRKCDYQRMCTAGSVYAS